MQHAWEISSNSHEPGTPPMHGDRVRRNLKSPRVSVVIPTLNEAENLPVVMPRLPEGLFEVVIVDGGSTDGTIDVARQLRPDVRVVQQTGHGKGNALYIHLMLPAVTGFDYRPSLLLDELVKELAPELLSKYQDAFAMPPSKLNLNELANMSIAPVPKPAEKKPGG